MALPERLRLIGGTGSPYTRKMVALLRYRRIPYSITWGDPQAVLDAQGIAKPKMVFHPTFLFESETGDLEAVCDSTPIIRRLEREHAGRSVIPTDPVLAFINYLIEDLVTSGAPNICSTTAGIRPKTRTMPVPYCRCLWM